MRSSIWLCRIERRPPRLDLKIYPYLPRATVATTSARAYLSLQVGSSVVSDTPQVLLTCNANSPA
jgi:hypothetical protein